MLAPRIRPPTIIAVTTFVAVLGALAIGTFLFENSREPPSCTPGQTFVVGQSERAYDPRIWGDWVAWVDGDYEPGKLPDGDVYVYNIATGKRLALATGPAMQSVPRVHGNNIVWRESPEDGSPTRMVFKNLATSEEDSYTGGPEFFNVVPRSIYRESVLFHADAVENSTSGLYVIDFATHAVTRVPDAVSEINGVDLWKDRVAYLIPRESRDGDFRLALLNLTTGERQILLESPRGIGRMRLQESFLAFEWRSDAERGASDIYLYDLRAGTTVPVATGEPNRPVDEWLPRAGTDTIAYMELTIPPPRLLVYRISDAQRIVVHDGGMEVDFDHWDDRTVFLDLEDNETGTDPEPWKVKVACS